MSNPELKHHKQNRQLFTRRCIAISIFISVFMLIIFARLIFLQIINHQQYTTQSIHNLLRIDPIEPTRGLIYDRNGVLLTHNIPVYNLTITPSKTKDINATLIALQKFIKLTPNEIKRFHRQIYLHARNSPVPVKDQLTEKEITYLYLNHYRLPGVNIQPNVLRFYPNGASISHLLGYIGRINSSEFKQVDQHNYQPSDYIGKTGIEKYYETQLRGKMGASINEVNASGQIVRHLKQTPATPGKNLYLTIDSRLQQFAYKALGKNNGAIVAISPSTGEVLAMVTKPSYDPNPFVKGISSKQYQQLLNNPNHPLYNRTIRGLYSPGSTIKPFHALNGLSHHVVTPQFSIIDHGWYRVPGTTHTFHDDNPLGHGVVNLHKAIRVSCDTYFYNLSVKLGITRIHKFLQSFGFGNPTNIDLPNELAGVLPNPEWKESNKQAPWYTGDTVNVGIGQGMLLVTPLQLAMATAAIAEHGKRFQAHLALKWQIKNGINTPYKITSLTPIKLKSYYWQTVINAMEDVIARGTARLYGPHPGYEVAGKTGTAQVYGTYRDEDTTDWQRPKKLRNNHLFIDFAPVSNPKIAVAVVVEHASFADTIAGNVTRFYLKNCTEQANNHAPHTSS